MYEFDFKTLLKTLAQRKKLIILNTIIAVVLGLGLAFSIPKTYKSEIKMVTETQKSNNLGSMGSLASLAGVNLSQGEDAISPELYPNVLATNKFIIDMLGKSVVTAQGKKYNSYVEYAKAEERLPWWSNFFKAMGAFFSKLFGKENDEIVKLNPKINPTRLTLAEEQMVKTMKNTLLCNINKETDVITITATAQDPYVAKQLVDYAGKKLQQFIADYRTSKTRTDLLYYQKLEKQLYQKYQIAQAAYAKFSDSHQDLFLKTYSTKETDLENAMQQAYTAYSNMKQQVGVAEGKVQEKTPVFTIVEDSYVANRAASPKKLIFLLAFAFLGSFGTVLWLYVRLLFSKPSHA